MKIRSLYPKFILFVLFFTVSGCEIIDMSNTGNYFSYDGKEYSLEKGYKSNFGYYTAEDKTYVWDIILVSNGIEYYYESKSFSGRGEAFQLHIVSSSEMQNGTYSFSQKGEFKIDYMTVGIDYNIDDDTGEYIETFDGAGTVEINKKGKKYEIVIDCKTKEGKEISGFYKGSLTVIEN